MPPKAEKPTKPAGPAPTPVPTPTPVPPPRRPTAYSVGCAACHAAAGPGDAPAGRMTFDVTTMLAASDVEALESALRYARHRWPPAEGWTNHSAAVSDVALVQPPEPDGK